MIKTSKPWGEEELLGLTSKIAMKKLFMKAGHRCSLQYHEKKDEVFFVLSGTMRFTVGPNEKELNSMILVPGGSYTILAGTVHRMEAVTDCYYLEASSTELDDVIRLKDDFDRVEK